MNVTESGFKNRQLHMEDYLQMVSAEQKEYAEVFDYSKITEKGGVITDYWTNNLAYSRKGYWRMAKALNQIFSNRIIVKLGYTSMLDYYLVVCEN